MKKILIIISFLNLLTTHQSHAMLGATQETQIRNKFKEQLSQLQNATSAQEASQIYKEAQDNIALLSAASKKNLKSQLDVAKSTADEKFTRTTLTGVRSEKEICEQELARAKTTIAELNQKLEEAQKSNVQIMQTSSETENLKKISDSHKSENEELKKTIESQKNELRIKNGDIQSLNERLKRQEDLNLSITEGKTKELVQKNQELDKEIENKRKELEKLKINTENYTIESNKLINKVEDQKKEISEKNIEIEKLNKEISDKNIELGKLKNTMTEAAQESNNLINKVEKQKIDLQKLQENIDENTKESQKLVNKIGEQERTISEQTKEIEKLKTTYNEADKAAKDLINKTEILKKEIDEKTQKIETLNIELKEKEGIITVTKKIIHELGGEGGEKELEQELASIKLINGYMDGVSKKLEESKDLKIDAYDPIKLSRSLNSETKGYLPLASINAYLQVLKGTGHDAIFKFKQYTDELVDIAKQAALKKQASTLSGDYYYAKDVQPLINAIINFNASDLRPLTTLIPYKL